MSNEDLISILSKLLEVDQAIDLDFLNEMSEDDLKTLIACIRDRIERTGRN